MTDQCEQSRWRVGEDGTLELVPLDPSEPHGFRGYDREGNPIEVSPTDLVRGGLEGLSPEEWGEIESGMDLKLAGSRDVAITVQADPFEGGSVSGGGIYRPHDYIQFTASPEKGWKFVRWVMRNSTYSTNRTMFYSVGPFDRTFHAEFELGDELSDEWVEDGEAREHHPERGLISGDGLFTFQYQPVAKRTFYRATGTGGIDEGSSPMVLNYADDGDGE